MFGSVGTTKIGKDRVGYAIHKTICHGKIRKSMVKEKFD